jgi:hypothetical protein
MTRIALKFGVALFCALVGLPSSQARITRIEIDRVESPTFGGASFGNVGQYEKLAGRAYGELDPRNEANRGIVYLDQAPRNAAGRVEYSIDVLILKPLDMSRGNRTLIYDVVNRGNLRAIQVFNLGGSNSNDPSSIRDAGDGFLFNHGYTIVSSGWPGDALPGNNRLTGRFPVATHPDGKPVTKLITIEYLFTKPAYTISLGYDGGTNTRPHPAVMESAAQARLLRRPGPLAPRETIPAGEWSFGRCPDGRNATPSNVDLCYPAGFSPNYIYDLVYVAQDPLVMGIGFASTRDLVSFLRRERSAANPLIASGAAQGGEDAVRRAIGFGRSQSGRYIKDFVYHGFNLDEGRRMVFEGIMPLISGSRLMSINGEFGMPSRTVGHYGGDQFPHTYATIQAPVSGKRDGWLERCTQQRVCPKVMHMDSGTEAWGSRNSLVVADARGKNDQPVPENVRLYYFSSTQHNPASKPGYGICKHLSNPNPRIETIRALLVAMQEWITRGTPPPSSRFPRVSDGTLVPPLPESAFAFPQIPGVTYSAKYNPLSVKDFSVQPPRSIPEKSYTVLVPKVDADGNDIGGVRSVTLEAPLGTYMGWNQRKAGFMEDEYCGLQGSYIPFAKTAAERGADPRPSLQERYGSKAAYVEKVEAAAARLVADRLLLPEDAARVVEEARKRDIGI